LATLKGAEPTRSDVQLRIGQLANLVSVTPKTIRHYHKIGLLPKPRRSEKGYRLYGVADLYRLKLVLRLKEIGFSLADIRAILRARDADSALRRRLEKLDQSLSAKMDELNRQRQRIRELSAEDVSLNRIDQPEAQPSLTYRLLMDSLRDYAAGAPDEVKALDRALLARLDAFHWGDAYREYWSQLGHSLSDRLEPLRAVRWLFAAASDLDADDPRLEDLADEIARHLQSLRPALRAPDLGEPLQAVFAQVIGHSIQDVFSSAQKRLVGLIRQRFSD